MASKQDPKRLAVLVVLLVAVAIVAALRLRPLLLESVLTPGGSAVQVGSYSVPVLGWERDEARAVPSPGAVRNVFTFGAPPTPTPDRRPTPTPLPTQPPPPPAPTPTPVCFPSTTGGCLPAPPQFPLAYLGWLGPDRLPIAIFRDGDDVIAVPRGDTVKQQFIVRDVGPNAVTVGFAGYAESVTSKVPLAR